MGLQAAFSTAQSALLTTATRLSVSSRNVATADDTSVSRKIAVVVTTGAGEARVVNITRAAGTALFDRMLGATSASAASAALGDGLTALSKTVGDPESATSPAALVGAFSDALATAAAAPDDAIKAQAAVTAAQNLTRTLNDAGDTVQQVRTDADAGIVTAVARVNDLLQRFEVENAAVVQGSAAGADVTDALDRRDAILASISEEMGISTGTRASNDMVIYTDSGVTLFDRGARQVTFAASGTLDAATRGQAVYVDGVAVAGPDAVMPLKSGAIFGLATLRDDVAVTCQSQLDEIARGLIAACAETSQSGGTVKAGLFTTGDGSGTVPDVATPGLAARIAVNPAADPDQGGSVTTLRDGGMNGAQYVANTSASASYGDRLSALVDALGASRHFDAATGLSTDATLAQFSAASASWLEGRRQGAVTRLDTQTAVLSAASSALSAATGVNLDQEYAAQLELERSYQASSKLMGVVNALYDSLFGIIG